jgi:hypothetical protein
MVDTFSMLVRCFPKEGDIDAVERGQRDIS